MVELFAMYQQEMCCQFIVGVFDKEVCSEPEFDDLAALCMIPSDDPMINKYPKHSHVSNENPTVANQSTAPNGATTQPIANDANVEGERKPDMFNNEEEYVGVDDKHICTSVPCAQTNFADNVADVDDDVADDVNAEGGVPLEAQVNDADPQEIHVVHDPKNPNIVKEALFPDIVSFRKAVRYYASFRKAVRHYAMIRGFELADIKTDPTRFIAKCKAEGCP
jgi:hypothetical protein